MTQMSTQAPAQAPPISSAEDLVLWARRRREYVRQIKSLAELSADYVAQQRLTELVDVLAAKQQLVDAYQSLAGQFARHVDLWRPHLTAAQAAACRAWNAQERADIDDILSSDARQTQLLSSQREATRHQLAQVNGGHHMLQTYRDDTHVGSGLLDVDQ